MTVVATHLDRYALEGGTYSVVSGTNGGNYHVNTKWWHDETLDNPASVFTTTQHSPEGSSRISMDLAFNFLHPGYVALYEAATHATTETLVKDIGIIASTEYYTAERRQALCRFTLALAVHDFSLSPLVNDLWHALRNYATEVTQ